MLQELEICLILIGLIYKSFALENGLARTPPMGWMHWQRFRCTIDCDQYPTQCVSEELFKRITDQLVSDGYANAGYEYVIIDDCWMEPVREKHTQKLVPDRKRFPSGLKALAKYIHDRGLKFGLYQTFGVYTCEGYPGIINHMELDAKSFAEWDVDYVKLDGCYTDIHLLEKGFLEFGNLLNRTGRPMVYSCSWPAYQEMKGILPKYELVKKYCNLFRNWIDINDSLESLFKITDHFARYQYRLQPNAGPGHWNDPDMLLLGNFGLSYDQSRLQMAIWSILAAPLIMSNDLEDVIPEIRSILQNRAVIAVNQDALGIQGWKLFTEKYIQVWVRPILPLNIVKSHSFAIAFVSRRAEGVPFLIEFKLNKLGLSNENGYTVVNLFDSTTILGFYRPSDYFQTRVNPNGVTFYKFTVV